MKTANRPPVWNHATKEVIESRETDPEAGLSADEARRRLEEYGPNRI
ncbi:MAG: cation-transporting P-type ATPase, partial [Spirochaetota bacterium]